MVQRLLARRQGPTALIFAAPVGQEEEEEEGQAEVVAVAGARLLSVAGRRLARSLRL